MYKIVLKHIYSLTSLFVVCCHMDIKAVLSVKGFATVGTGVGKLTREMHLNMLSEIPFVFVCFATGTACVKACLIVFGDIFVEEVEPISIAYR